MVFVGLLFVCVDLVVVLRLLGWLFSGLLVRFDSVVVGFITQSCFGFL